MITMTATEQPSAQKKDCDCGCSHAECCELECLVQPRFFCGQLLADQDLTAMVDWVKGKTGLARYRHGWGIVCGLDVHCGKNGTVTVSPGYALDCCGRDIVLCEETKFDLAGCWQRPSDPCGPGDVQRPPAGGGPAAPAPQNVHFGPFQAPETEVQWFDLYVRYSESQSDGRTALARGGCGGAAGCEYTRVKEGGELYCKPSDRCPDPNAENVRLWDENYYNGLAEVFAELERIGMLSDPRSRLARLLAYLREHPLHTFCFIREWLCDQQDEETGLSEDEFDDAVFWILQDWRNAYFAAECQGCGPETGVLLARIAVRLRRVNQREKFSTIEVGAYQPFRRLVAKDDFPAPPGYWNLASYIWQPSDSVELALRDKGFTTVRSQIFTQGNLQDLRNQLLQRRSLYHRPENRALIAYVVVDRCERQRVVYFGYGQSNFRASRSTRTGRK